MTDEIAIGVTRDWVGTGDDAIAIYKIRSLDISSLKTWNEAVYKSLQDLPETAKTFYLIYDLSAGGVSLPYLIYNNFVIDNIAVFPPAKTQFDDLLKKRTDLKVALALVISASLSGRIAVSRGRSGTGGTGTTSETESQLAFKTFFKREPAVEWLRGLDQSE